MDWFWVAIIVWLGVGMVSNLRQTKLKEELKEAKLRTNMGAIYVAYVSQPRDADSNSIIQSLIATYGQKNWDAFVAFDDGKLYRSACGVWAGHLLAACLVGGIRVFNRRGAFAGVTTATLLRSMEASYRDQMIDTIGMNSGGDEVRNALSQLAQMVADLDEGYDPDAPGVDIETTSAMCEPDPAPVEAPAPTPRRGRARSVT